MKLYLRCVFANKFTLAGLTLALAGLTLTPNVLIIELSPIFLLMFITGMTMAGLTGYGTETYFAYKKHLKRLKRGQDCRLSKESYCRRVGRDLAEQDWRQHEPS